MERDEQREMNVKERDRCLKENDDVVNSEAEADKGERERESATDHERCTQKRSWRT